MYFGDFLIASVKASQGRTRLPNILALPGSATSMVTRMLQAHGQLAPDLGGPAEEPSSMTLVSQQTSAETSASSSPDMLSPMLSPMTSPLPPSVAPVSVDAVHDGCSPGGSGAVRRCRSSRSSVDGGMNPATFQSTLGAKTSITATQLGNELLAGGEFLLLDVRSIAAYQRGHVQGALSVACSTMLQRYRLNPPATRPPPSHVRPDQRLA